MPSVLQDILFIAIVVAAMLAIFKLRDMLKNHLHYRRHKKKPQNLDKPKRK